MNESFFRGYTVNNLSDDINNKKNKTTFRISKIETVQNNEILSITLSNGVIQQIHKKDINDVPSLFFKLYTSQNEFICDGPGKFENGIGLAEYLAKKDLISPFEIGSYTFICRTFLLGKTKEFVQVIKKHNISVSEEIDKFIKYILDNNE